MEDFVRDLQTLAIHCEYTDANEIIRDRFAVDTGIVLMKTDSVAIKLKGGTTSLPNNCERRPRSSDGRR